MSEKKERGPAKRIILAAALLIAAAVLTVGISYARYRITSRQAADIEMGVGFSGDSIFIIADQRDTDGKFTGLPHNDGTGSYSSPRGWTLVSEDRTVYQISFLLSNVKTAGRPAASDQEGYVEVFVTEGIKTDGLIIQLDSPFGNYLATGTAVSEGTSYYKAYGKGTVYRFLNPSGEQISWHIPGGREYYVPMKVTVWGEFSDPGALTVIAEGVPVS